MANERTPQRTQEHEHGISPNRAPKNDEGLPHNGDGGHKQPYSREAQEYSGDAVTHPPQDQTKQRDDAKQPGQP